MKKITYILSILLFLISSFANLNITSYAQNSYYAKIQQEDVYLYSAPIDDLSKTIFEIPNTYFVKLIDDENENFYYAMYKNVYGYVKKNQVTPMQGSPINPFANATFRIFSPDGIGLYSSPSITQSTKIIDIPYLTNSLTFYGYKIGEEAIPDKSNQWIYCNFENNNEYYGYVYSVFCDQLSQIQDNYENFEIIENPNFNMDDNPTELSTVAMTFIIIGVSIPCLIVIYLLLKPTFLKEKVLNERPKVKKKHHGDYFEFDDSELN